MSGNGRGIPTEAGHGASRFGCRLDQYGAVSGWRKWGAMRLSEKWRSAGGLGRSAAGACGWRHVFPAEARNEAFGVLAQREAAHVPPLVVPNEGMAAGGDVQSFAEGVLWHPMLSAREAFREGYLVRPLAVDG